MSEHINGSQSAYPTNGDLTYDGLTKRELFAAMAMQGLLAGHDEARVYEGEPGPKNTAIDAIRVADALIAELAK
tara:strand:- start:3000 stop:3221 length:222 start_codon:yes stop_codon:yes gene_type:complete